VTIELPVVGEDESERSKLIPNACDLCNPYLNGAVSHCVALKNEIEEMYLKLD
jgi:hypothetical protein